MSLRHRSAFIAFTKEDGETKASLVREQLITAGLPRDRIFQFTLESKKDLSDASEEVDEHLREKDALIVIYSAQSRVSEWVNAELASAKALKKPIYLIKNVHNIAIDLPEFMSNATYTVVGHVGKLAEFFGDEGPKIVSS